MSLPVVHELKYTKHVLETIVGCHDRTARKLLLQELQEYGAKQNPQLVSLFDRLNSSDELTVREAEEEIKYLQDQQIPFHTIVLHSLPLWPVDTTALKQIAFDQSESKHPLLRERAFETCSFLVTNGYKEGYETAAIFASKKMRSEDVTIQKEGFKYFALLLNQWQPQLSQDDLVLAISIAKKIGMTDQWVETDHFFQSLIEHGRGADVALLKNTVLDLCASDNSDAFSLGNRLCKLITRNHHNLANLIEISLQGASSMCTSEDTYKRSLGLDQFWELLRQAPTATIDPLLRALEIESRRENPQVGIIQRLEELAGHDFSNLMCLTEEVVLQRAAQDALKLLQILTNLSTSDSPYAKQQALKLKRIVETRMQAVK